MEILNADAIKKHPRLFTRVSKLNEAILQRNTNQKNVSSSIYNFSINTTICKMITVDGFTTYTFEVIREQDNGFFENLVVKELANGMFETKIYRYNVTLQEKENILKGIDVDMTNKISTLPIDDPNFVSDIFSKIYFSNFCYEASSVFVPGQACKNGHLHPDLCDLQGSEAPTLGSYQTVYTMVSCPDTGGGGSGNVPTGPTDAGAFDGVGTSPTGGGQLIDSVLVKTPCDYLKELADPNKQKIKPAIDILKNKLNLNPNKEWGQDFKMGNNPNDYYSFMHSNYLREGSDNEGTVSTVQGIEWIGSAHIHTEKGVNIYSFMDVRNLLLSYNATNAKRRSYVVAMYLGLNNSGLAYPENMTLYAIKIDDVALFQQKINAIWDHSDYSNLNEFKKAEKLNKIFYKEIEKYGGNLIAGFLNTFSNYGISTYKATNQDLTTWSKLTVGSTPYNVTEQPCNQ